MNKSTIALTAALITPLAQAGEEEHFDILLGVNDGVQIITGGTNGVPGEPFETIRIFESELGEGPIAHFSDEPGFNAFSGTFTPGTLIGFEMMDHLRRWNPAEQHFDEIPAETLLINLGLTSVTTPAENEAVAFPQPGFFFAAASGSGALHQHINFFLNTPQTPGVYLFQFRVVTNGGESPSEPVYIVFSEQAMEDEIDNAITFVENLVNPPSICAGDCDGSATVDFNDLVCTLFQFGGDDPATDCDGSGEIDFNDLVCALFAFGPCE